jgi:hypothetical protein
MSCESAAALVAGVLFVLNKVLHYRPHLNSFGEMRGKIFELYTFWVLAAGAQASIFPSTCLTTSPHCLC